MQIKKVVLGLFILGITVVSFTSCSNEDDVNTINQPNLTKDINILNVNGGNVIETELMKFVMQATDSLTKKEITYLYSLLGNKNFQEKVYNSAVKVYPNEVVMKNIKTSVSSYKKAVEYLYKYYNIVYFQIDEKTFEKMFQEALAKMTSVTESYKILAEMEENNVANYTKDLRIVKNENIKLLLENLLIASRNHLRSVNNCFKNHKIIYSATFLSQDKYNEIVNSQKEEGKKYKQSQRISESNVTNGGVAPNIHNYTNGTSFCDSLNIAGTKVKVQISRTNANKEITNNIIKETTNNNLTHNGTMSLQDSLNFIQHKKKD